LTAVYAPHPTQPLAAALFNPPIKPTTRRPRSHLNLDGWINFPAISIGKPLHIVIAEVHK
jgi:hypothetical protein